MNDTPTDTLTDPKQTLAYSGRKQHRWFLRTGLIGLAAGGVLLTLQHVDPGTLDRFEMLMVAVTLVGSAGAAVYGLYRLRAPGKPALVLSPAGLRLHIEGVKNIDIPWREVRGIETIDIAGRTYGQFYAFTGVTAVLVTKAFYDRNIHVDSWFQRGPGWETVFIPKDDMVQVAVHHHMLPTTAAELRAAIEARWKAFRDEKPAPRTPWPDHKRPGAGAAPAEEPPSPRH